MLGVRAAAGRLLGPADDVPGAPSVAVLSYGLWQQEFSGAPDAIGRIVSIEGEPFTIVGVAEQGFDGLQVGFPARLMIPLDPQAFLPATLRGLALSANLFARLPENVSLEQANVRLQSMWQQILKESIPPGFPTRPARGLPREPPRHHGGRHRARLLTSLEVPDPALRADGDRGRRADVVDP